MTRDDVFIFSSTNQVIEHFPRQHRRAGSVILLFAEIVQDPGLTRGMRADRIFAFDQPSNRREREALMAVCAYTRGKIIHRGDADWITPGAWAEAYDQTYGRDRAPAIAQPQWSEEDVDLAAFTFVKAFHEGSPRAQEEIAGWADFEGNDTKERCVSAMRLALQTLPSRGRR